MNKFNLIKKLLLSALVILYDIVSLLWCYVLVESLIYNFFGGADIPTWIFKVGNVLQCVLLLLFVLLNIATLVLLTVSTFKKQISSKLHILLCVFLALFLIIFRIIPPQIYAISLFLLARKIALLNYLDIIYIILSLVVIAESILFAIKRRKKKE